jgi:hypothetical protein
VEAAHGGRGNSSSRDRYSSHSNGRGGRGVSRRSEYRGVYAFLNIYYVLFEDVFGMLLKSFGPLLQF